MRRVCVLKSLLPSFARSLARSHSLRFTIFLSFPFIHSIFLLCAARIYSRIYTRRRYMCAVENWDEHTTWCDMGKERKTAKEGQKKTFFGKRYAKSTDTHKYCSLPLWAYIRTSNHVNRRICEMCTGTIEIAFVVYVCVCIFLDVYNMLQLLNVI